jgi:hypothetical protein
MRELNVFTESSLHTYYTTAIHNRLLSVLGPTVAPKPAKVRAAAEAYSPSPPGLSQWLPREMVVE